MEVNEGEELEVGGAVKSSETKVCTEDQDEEKSVTVGVKLMEKVESCLLADPFVVSRWVKSVRDGSKSLKIEVVVAAEERYLGVQDLTTEELQDVLNGHVPSFQIRLPPEVNRILYIRNLPYKITAEEMYDIFGKYGPIRQIRTGNTPESRGTAYVVYEDIFDAKNACDHLSGFNVCNRYLVVLYYNANRAFQKMDTKKKEEQLKLLKEKYGINTDPPK
uniref:Splicing factor 3B subunit 6 n=2 Tax=Euteleosteomorpha TaxID=1489388 RepID=A0A4W5NJJ7_9TELE